MSERDTNTGETDLHSSPSRAMAPTRRELLRAAGQGTVYGLAVVGLVNIVGAILAAFVR